MRSLAARLAPIFFLSDEMGYSLVLGKYAELQSLG